MSLTTSPCPNCGDGIFADDSHACVRERKFVTHKGHFPNKPHWAIIGFMPCKAPSGVDSSALQNYSSFFTEAAWKQKITELTLDKKEFIAFKASAPARVAPNYSVSVDISVDG